MGGGEVVVVGEEEGGDEFVDYVGAEEGEEERDGGE